MAEYNLVLTDSTGQRLTDAGGENVLNRTMRFSASRTANRIAQFSMLLPASINPALLRDDNMVQVWRKAGGGPWRLFRPYFIRKRRYYYEENVEILEIGGPDCNDLLRRRVVAARPDNSQVDKLDNADDMMKEIVIEAFADGTNPAPDFGTRAADAFSVDNYLTLGPIIEQSFPWEKLLTYGGSGLLPKIAEASRAEGFPLYFDVIPDTVSAERITFKFVTRLNYPGRDVTGNMVFSLALGNMENPEYIEDATREENYLYAFGQGEAVDQAVEQVYDQSRVESSAWGRIEGAVDASSQPDDGVADAGRSALTSRAVKRSFFADPISTQETAFGLDWNWGDKVRAVYHGVFDAVIESVTLTVRDENESIEGRLRNLDA